MDEKFCGNCGASIKASAEFCPQCGAKQTVAPKPDETESEQVNVMGDSTSQTASNGATTGGLDPEKLKKYGPLALIALAAIIVIIVIIAVVVNVTKYTKIDAEELFRVDFSGLDGNGTAVVSFAYGPEASYGVENIRSFSEDWDEEEIYEYLVSGYDDLCEEYEELTDEEKNKYEDLKSSDYLSLESREISRAFSKADSRRDAEKMRDALIECISFDISDDKDLSNGDTVTVTLDVDEDELKDEGIKLKLKKSYEVKVSGLEDGEELDPFKDINVVFEGDDGSGNVYVNTDSCDSFVRNKFSFRVSDGNNWEFSNGDKITIKASYLGYDYDEDIGGAYDSDTDTYYIFSETTSKEYTVEGLRELTEVDVFEYVDVVYEGLAPDNIYIDLEWKEDTPEYITDNVDVYESYDDVVDGGTFTLTAYVYSGLAEEGYKLKSETKDMTFDFSLAPQYMTASDVTTDTYAEEFDATAETEASSNVGNTILGVYDFGTLKSVDKIEYVETSFSVAKDEDEYTRNNLTRIYKVTGTFEDDGKESSHTYYLAGYISNVTQVGGTPTEIDTDYIYFGETETLELARSGYTFAEDDDYTTTTVK